MESDYALIDCGNGRRLENFGGVLCDRPCPAALTPRRAGGDVWARAGLRFDAESREWTGFPPADWSFRGRCEGLPEVRLALTPGKNGQIGIFPEQMENWEWLARTVSAAVKERGRVKILNGFAYTGGSTLFCAAAGAEVSHVDAAAAAVSQARRNAELSGLSDRPVRWLVDDVCKFLRREIRRESFYDGIILDPPAFGRSGKSVWRLETGLPELLDLASRVLTPRPLFVLLTCHPTGWRPEDLDAVAGRRFQVFTEMKVAETRIQGKFNTLTLGLRWRGEKP